MEVGTLTRCEVDRGVVAYCFDLRTNDLATTLITNPHAGREHVFKAYRVIGEPSDPVTLRDRSRILVALADAKEDEDDQ